MMGGIVQGAGLTVEEFRRLSKPSFLLTTHFYDRAVYLADV